jgi:hypothetical protein
VREKSLTDIQIKLEIRLGEKLFADFLIDLEVR